MDLIYRFDPYRELSVDRPVDAAAAIRRLLAGNRRLVEFIKSMQQTSAGGQPDPSRTVVPVDLLSLGLPFLPGAALDQAPFALVLGCSDARVPIESVFDLRFNSLFVVRIAGNVLGTECLGSVDFAVRTLTEGLKAVVVLSHTGCGAVTAAVDTYLSPNDYANIAFTHALRSLVDRVLVSVRGAAHALERLYGHEIHRRQGFRQALIETSVYLNAAITAFDLERAIGGAGGSSLEVFYGACDITTMMVREEPNPLGGEPSLGRAPRSGEEFIALADNLARCVAARLED